MCRRGVFLAVSWAVFGAALPGMAAAPTLAPVRASAGPAMATARPTPPAGRPIAKHRPAWAEAQLAEAEALRAQGDARRALARARAAAQAFDAQVELHKTLSEALPTLADAKAERAAALALGLRRDEATFLAAELARALGDDDAAIQGYVHVVQSQADTPRGRSAYAALQALGWAAVPTSPSGAPR